MGVPRGLPAYTPEEVRDVLCRLNRSDISIACTQLLVDREGETAGTFCEFATLLTRALRFLRGSRTVMRGISIRDTSVRSRRIGTYLCHLHNTQGDIDCRLQTWQGDAIRHLLGNSQRAESVIHRVFLEQTVCFDSGVEREVLVRRRLHNREASGNCVHILSARGSALLGITA